MNAKKPALSCFLMSDLARFDAHVVKEGEYDDLPELDDATNPRKLLSKRLPADVLDRWKANGPGWQTRMAERLSSVL